MCGKVGEGKSSEALPTFFSELGAEKTAGIELISIDMSAAYERAIRDAAPGARIVFDHFHVARLATDAVDEVRRAQVAQLPPNERSTLKRTRWPTLKRPQRLKPTHQAPGTERQTMQKQSFHPRCVTVAFCTGTRFMPIKTVPRE